MFNSFIRKARQVAADPVLRKWVWRRVTGGVAALPAFTAHRPSYLNGVAPPDSRDPVPAEPFKPLATPPPVGPIELPLPGLRLRLEPGREGDVFTRLYDDIETLLALHRFAWVPLVVGSGNTTSWVQALWDVWRETFAQPLKGWAWHPYTAVERAVNFLDLARTKGLPEPVDETVALLGLHVNVIFNGLEYFGDHDTSNHLSNNGRGLYRLGLALGLEGAVEAGAKILVEEAKRIFSSSGVLREGSSHYHLLIARNYADAWLAARRHGRPEAAVLRDITVRALAVIPWLILPGGMPLIGDVSPDCPPEYLWSLAGIESGWVAGLPKDDRKALLALIDETRPVAKEDLCGDGWLRYSRGPWSGLWHAAPGGWPGAPGHGHQDTGGFELHFQDIPVFVDPGSGVYGETEPATQYRSGWVHNTLTVDGADPFPANKPYYDNAFRQAVAGPPPELSGGGDEVTLSHHGFQRLKGAGQLRRRWRFTETAMVLTDELEGEGSHRLTRRLMTPLEVEAGSGGVVLRAGERTFHLNAPEASAVVSGMTLWRAYGDGRPGHVIEFTSEASLPWTGEVRLEVL